RGVQPIMTSTAEAKVAEPAPRALGPIRRIANSLFTFPAAIAAILVAKAYFTCRDNIADTDLWWHLRNAQYTLRQGHLPSLDTYSFTAAGSPWVDHSWLSELIYYSAFRAFGLRGIFLVFAAAVTALSLAVFLMCKQRNSDPLVAGIAAII